MAISIITSPDLYQPVYNPIYTQVSSTLTSEEAFSFLFDVYVNGTFVTRDRLLPRPGTTTAIYSPARVLESYVSYDLTHNLIGNSESANCIDKYEVKVGEEYIQYWSFYDTQYDSFSASSYTILISTTKHSFVLNDYIVISNTVYGTFDGVHKIVYIPDEYTVLINKSFTTTPTNPGKATWSDKRKTVSIGPYTNEVLNPTFQYLGGTGSGVGKNKWLKTNVPICFNQFGIETFNRMIFDMNDNSCGDTISVNYVGGTFNVGRQYTITFNVDSIINPSGSSQSVQVSLGGNLTTPFSGTGSYTQIVTCGTGGVLSLIGYFDADTAGFGYHGFTMDSISITEVSYDVIGYDFNGVIQYEEVPEWDYTKYIMGSASVGKFLTNQPYTVKTKLSDRGSIGWLNTMNHAVTPNRNYYMLISAYIPSINVTSTTRLRLSSMESAQTTNRMIQEFGVYPYNINKQSYIEHSYFILTTGVSKYNIQLQYEETVTAPGVYVPCSEVKNFELDHCGTRFEPVRFMFVNSLGQFDYYNATLLSRTTVAVSRDTYTKTLPLNYVQGDRGKTTINVNAQENYTISTDWVSEETAHWLTYEFLTSNEIYVLDNIVLDDSDWVDGTIKPVKITPIVLNVSDWEDKKRVNDKLLNYTITYSKAVTLNTRRN